MTSLDIGSAQESFEIIISCSPVYECALEIAALTRPEILDKLERTPEQWRHITRSMSVEFKNAVDLAGRVHTWRSLLFLAHRSHPLRMSPAKHHTDVFVQWMKALGPSIKTYAAPYLGRSHTSALAEALAGNAQQQAHLLAVFQDNSVVVQNLQFLFEVSPTHLLEHLEGLVTRWDAEVWENEGPFHRALELDVEKKRNMLSTMSVQDLIKFATNGEELTPEPDLGQLWLVPHIAYRPFTIHNRLPNCKVLYYPVQEEFLPGASETRTALHVANLYKAVGDVNRVRILKLLKDGRYSVTDIGLELELSKSTAHHHLTLLRTANLVRIEDGLYTLNEDALKNIHSPLVAFLGLTETVR